MKLFVPVFVFMVVSFLMVGGAWAGTLRNPAQAQGQCSRTPLFACPGGGSPDSCTLEDGKAGYSCKAIPSQEQLETVDVAVSVRCLTAKPAACPGGGVVKPCGDHLWICAPLPAP